MKISQLELEYLILKSERGFPVEVGFGGGGANLTINDNTQWVVEEIKNLRNKK